MTLMDPAENTVTISDATVTLWLDVRGHPTHVKILADDYKGHYKVIDTID